MAERLKEGEEVVWSNEQRQQRIEELAQEIQDKHKGDKKILLLGILTGGVTTAVHLGEALENNKDNGIDVDLRFIAVTRYGDSQESSENPIILFGIEPDVIKDSHTIIVDDVLDKGPTLQTVQQLISGMNPATLETCVLVVKEGQQKVGVKIDYFGFVEKKGRWLFGSGMDKDGRLRRLANFIGAIKN